MHNFTLILQLKVSKYMHLQYFILTKYNYTFFYKFTFKAQNI